VGVLTDRQLLTVITDVSAGLSHMHTNGMLHRSVLFCLGSLGGLSDPHFMFGNSCNNFYIVVNTTSTLVKHKHNFHIGENL